MIDEPAVASAALRTARRALGVSQEQLAERARLSTRAVRDLEAGRTPTPRRSTLDALAGALEFDAERRREFVRSWSIRTSASVRTGEKPAACSSRSAFRDHSITSHVVIGPERRTTVSSCTSIAEAIRPGVDHRSLTWWQLDDEDPANIGVRDLHDGVRRDATLHSEGRALTVDLRLDRPVSVGDFRVFRADFDLSRAYRATASETSKLVEMSGPGTRLIALHVEFRGCPPPRRVWALGSGPGRTAVRARRIASGEHLEYVAANPVAGAHGFEWEW